MPFEIVMAYFRRNRKSELLTTDFIKANFPEVAKFNVNSIYTVDYDKTNKCWNGKTQLTMEKQLWVLCIRSLVLSFLRFSVLRSSVLSSFRSVVLSSFLSVFLSSLEFHRILRKEETLEMFTYDVVIQEFKHSTSNSRPDASLYARMCNPFAGFAMNLHRLLRRVRPFNEIWRTVWTQRIWTWRKATRPRSQPRPRHKSNHLFKVSGRYSSSRTLVALYGTHLPFGTCVGIHSKRKTGIERSRRGHVLLWINRALSGDRFEMAL